MNDEDTISWKIPCLGNLWMNMDSHKKEEILYHVPIIRFAPMEGLYTSTSWTSHRKFEQCVFVCLFVCVLFIVYRRVRGLQRSKLTFL